MTEHFVLVANAAAGATEQEQLEAACAALSEAAGEVEQVACDAPSDLDAALDALEGRTLVVAGGDGSLHLAVQKLWERDPEALARTPIGLVPLGTGNDFARGIGLSLDPVEAARACLHGTSTTYDVLVDDLGQVVVNAVHAGLGALAAERAEGLKPRLGPAAYPVGALVEGVVGGAHDLRVELDGTVLHDGAALMVAAANGPSIGGGTPIAPEADPADGLLDVVVVTAVGPVARVAFGAALRTGAHVERDDVAVARGRSVTISGDPVPHDLDGELLEARAAATYTVRPQAWRLLSRTR